MGLPASTRFDRRTLLVRSAMTTALIGMLDRATLPASAGAARRALDIGIADLIAGNTAFAVDAYHQLRASNDRNVFFSPYSISLALAMTYAGAAGETATQMAETLGVTILGREVHPMFASLTADLDERGNPGPGADADEGERGLRIANALWGEQSYPFDPAFMTELEEHYGAGMELTDFINAPDAAREEINAWVEEQTGDRILDIVPDGAISDITRLVLANAIYFYGSWRETFEPSATEDDDFHLLDGTGVTVPFMRQTEYFPYAAGEGFQVIQLPYADSGFAMTIFLPDEGQFEAFEETLEAGSLEDVGDILDRTEVRLFLPKFEFDFAASLAETLQSLGMTDAFDPAVANFSGMVDDPAAEPIVIGDVLHKAFIAVDEEGTEAAAATVVIGEAAAAPGEQEEPVEVRIDRPFLFAIRDTETGSVLFLGRLMDPSGAS